MLIWSVLDWRIFKLQSVLERFINDTRIMNIDDKRGRRLLAYFSLIVGFSVGAYRIGYLMGH